MDDGPVGRWDSVINWPVAMHVLNLPALEVRGALLDKRSYALSDIVGEPELGHLESLERKTAEHGHVFTLDDDPLDRRKGQGRQC